MSGMAGMMGMIAPMMQGMAGSSFKPGTKAQAQANQTIQDKYAAAQSRQQAAQQPSGWDQFLTGTAQFGANMLRGFATGLAAYNPDNPYSSFAGGILGASRGLQAKMDEPIAARQRQFEREQQAADEQMAAATKEGIYRSQVDRASVMPDIGGIVAGVSVQAPPLPKTPQEPFGIQIGYGQTAAARTLGLVK